ncbi:hypothetical protein AB205_0221500 [Aquarana catesbeiana]|uniref:Uncharacterized protein n=1 Tax=Aquarana catesbeiana TaxID=8400 RepID=A0A2G9SDG6_AQUCT|nr:hypothetical protein AB205_0221500 [Aquarana catesbeiana]
MLQHRGARKQQSRLKAQPRNLCQWLRKAMLCNPSDSIDHHVSEKVVSRGNVNI